MTSVEPSSREESPSIFSKLHDDLKIQIISFVADAPFEENPNVPLSSLTHTIPQVCREFHVFSQTESLWKSAIQRQITQHERILWRGALKAILKENSSKPHESDDNDCDNNVVEGSNDDLSELTELELVDRVFETQKYPSFKALYQEVIQKHLRFTGPVFCMGSTLERLGQPYSLHFFEDRYRLMMSEIMRGQSDAVRRGEGQVQGENCDVCFIHAASPLRPTTMAVWVRVLRCGLYPDGRADAFMVPIQTVWIEDLRVRPNTGGLYYAQCLRLSRRKPDREAAVRYYAYRKRRRFEQNLDNQRSASDAVQPTLWSMLRSSFLAFCFFGVATTFVLKSFQFIFSIHSNAQESVQGGATSVAESHYDPTTRPIQEL